MSNAYKLPRKKKKRLKKMTQKHLTDFKLKDIRITYPDTFISEISGYAYYPSIMY